jgi:hypothetical protein
LSAWQGTNRTSSDVCGSVSAKSGHEADGAMSSIACLSKWLEDSSRVNGFSLYLDSKCSELVVDTLTLEPSEWRLLARSGHTPKSTTINRFVTQLPVCGHWPIRKSRRLKKRAYLDKRSPPNSHKSEFGLWYAVCQTTTIRGSELRGSAKTASLWVTATGPAWMRLAVSCQMSFAVREIDSDHE